MIVDVMNAFRLFDSSNYALAQFAQDQASKIKCDIV